VRDNPAERVIVDRFDALDDLKRIKWRAMDRRCCASCSHRAEVLSRNISRPAFI
jgi:hypothetical protein